jgi:DNA-binding XRE family transcriptional regulator
VPETIKIKDNLSIIRYWMALRPSLAQIPKIIEFLGGNPFEKETENLGERIREYRRVHGLSQKKLAEHLGVDLTTLGGWERGEHEASRRFIKRLDSFICSK